MNKKDDIPYGINYVKYKNTEKHIHTISFGGKKVLVSNAIIKNAAALGFFTCETTEVSLEMIFHTTDDVDFMINRLRKIRKDLKKNWEIK